jgi:purine-binding chemotaxis protein CheW
MTGKGRRMRDERPNKDKQRKTIDWNEIHRFMEEAQLAIKREWSPTLEEKKKILKTRAKRLAQEPEKKETVEKYIEVVEFLLSYEKYAIESSYVHEIYPLKELTPLPCTPPFVLGIINVHGQIFSVIDIKKFFELPEKGLSDLNKVIILHSEGPALSRVEGMEFGILADVILGVRQIPLTDIQPSLPTLTGIREEYLKGVTGEQVVILNAEKLLSDKKITVHEEA